MNVLLISAVVIYAIAAKILFVYAMNCYVMLWLYNRKRRTALGAVDQMRQRFGDPLAHPDLPIVTTQIPVYNEFNVVERCLRAVAAMRYAPGRHEIQVLDDSTDETRELIDRVAADLRSAGHDVKVVRRPTRVGFKAGALEHGLATARGSLVTVFDADFVPPSDYLTSIVPFFLENPRLGFAQARWGHVNVRHSMLTRVQALGIDGHFMIEQVARCWGNLFMNFNGTAGVWRRAAIADGGGWQSDTLTEDLDLSYRVQLRGWTTLYLPQIVVPAELPEDINALRGQQFRWAKGSFQTLIKLFPILLRSPYSGFRKAQAILHMSGYFVHPMMLTVSLLALPVLLADRSVRANTPLMAIATVPLILAIFGPSLMCIAGQYAAHRSWLRPLLLLPFLIVVGTGLAFSNTRAIVEAVVRRQSEFVRTPKRGDRNRKVYSTALPVTAFIEIGIGLYILLTLWHYVTAGQYGASPFLALYAAGFLFVGIMTIIHCIHSRLQSARL